MGFLQKLQLLFRPSISLKASTYQSFGYSEEISKTWLAKDAAENGYAKNVAVFHIIDQRAKAFSSIAFKCYQIQANGKRVELLNHPLKRLFDRPNPMNNRSSFLKNYGGFFALCGNAFMELVPGKGSISELWVRSNLEMSMKVGSRIDIPLEYIRTKNSYAQKFPVDPLTGDSFISHLKNFNPNDPYMGISPLSAAAHSVSGFNEASSWNQALMRNRGRPEGILKLKSSQYNLGGNLSTDQRAEIKKILEEETQGLNAGNTFVLPGDLEYTQLGLTPVEMDYILSKQTSVREICWALGYPPYLMGLPDSNSTFNNMEQALEYFFSNTTYFGDNILMLPDYDAHPAFASKRAAMWDRVEKSSILSINEKRATINYEEVEGGDEILVSPMLTPLSDIALKDPGSDLTPDSNSDSTDLESDAKKSEFKAVNLSSDLAKKNYTISVYKRRLAHERRFKYQVQKHLEWELEVVLKRLSQVDESQFETQIELALKETSPHLSKILESNYRLILNDFGGDVLAAFKSDSNLIETKGVQEQFLVWSNRWIKEQLPKRLDLIWGSTDKKLNKVVADSLDELSSQSETLDSQKLSKMIRDKYQPMTKTRSLTIARTETTIAASEGSLGAATEMSVIMGQPLLKQWVSVSDDRVRDSHLAMNGIEAEITEDFDVGGEAMSGPGDPDASPENVINCRCTLTYKTR
jgi:HK97 family phage portal protein